MFLVYGVWRSLVARTAGGREVAGSNPVTPIGAAAEFFKWENLLQYFFDFHKFFSSIKHSKTVYQLSIEFILSTAYP